MLLLLELLLLLLLHLFLPLFLQWFKQLQQQKQQQLQQQLQQQQHLCLNEKLILIQFNFISIDFVFLIFLLNFARRRGNNRVFHDFWSYRPQEGCIWSKIWWASWFWRQIVPRSSKIGRKYEKIPPVLNHRPVYYRGAYYLPSRAKLTEKKKNK